MLKKVTQGGRDHNSGLHAHKHLQNGSAVQEAIVVVINCVHQGIAIDSYTYIDVLQRYLKYNNLVLEKQVHDCIKKNRLEQNLYVANNLLKYYIRCGSLQNASKVFNKFMNKDIIS